MRLPSAAAKEWGAPPQSCSVADGYVVFTSRRAGFSAEEVALPRQPQPYGDLFLIRLDGTGLTRLTHLIRLMTELRMVLEPVPLTLPSRQLWRA